MPWYDYLAYFFGGVFFANAIPHTVAGVMGHAFQSPFAKPPGEGLSSSRVNTLWGFLNLAIGYFLIFHVGEFEARNITHAGLAFGGAILISLSLAQHFGKFHGGNFAVKKIKSI